METGLLKNLWCNDYCLAVSAPNSRFLINKDLQNSRLAKGLDKAGPFFCFQLVQCLVCNLPLLPSSDHSSRCNHVYFQSSWCNFFVWRLLEICFKFIGTWLHCHSFETKLGTGFLCWNKNCTKLKQKKETKQSNSAAQLWSKLFLVSLQEHLNSPEPSRTPPPVWPRLLCPSAQ